MYLIDYRIISGYPENYLCAAKPEIFKSLFLNKDSLVFCLSSFLKFKVPGNATHGAAIH
jgi:hypothetical protein